MINRYDIHNSDGYHNLSVSQSEDGEWVRYDDIAALIAATHQHHHQHPIRPLVNASPNDWAAYDRAIQVHECKSCATNARKE